MNYYYWDDTLTNKLGENLHQCAEKIWSWFTKLHGKYTIMTVIYLNEKKVLGIRGSMSL